MDLNTDELTDFDELLNLDGADWGIQPPYNDLPYPELSSYSSGTTSSFPITSSATCGEPLKLADFHTSNIGTPDMQLGSDLWHDSNTAPVYTKPPVPCDYCAARGLECFFINHDESGCSCCRALFRNCSFVSHKPKSGWLDTLDPVSEDIACDVGKVTGMKPLFSHGASVNDITTEYMKTHPERTSTRFPRAATLVLKRWLDANQANPYPTEGEKNELKDETGLSLTQISTWLANARKRGKGRPERASSPISVAGMPRATRQAHMDPFERWKHSPPEKEAPLDLIKEAAKNIPDGVQDSSNSSRSDSRRGMSKKSSNSSVSNLLAPSLSSFDTSHSSHGSSAGSRSSWNSRQSKTRRRRRNLPRAKLDPAKSDADKIFQCTFCTDTFHSKYDWTRHEKTMHMSLEKWICHPLGPIVTTSFSGDTICVYCHHPNPTPDHLDAHGHYECNAKDNAEGRVSRTFYRKDHLRQHLRLSHQCSFETWMEDWKIAPTIVRSRCGFCPDTQPATFETWQERADHLAKHFKAGARMRDWKGTHGFDAEIAAQVTSAMPPFMIDHERTTPDPFSASAGHTGVWITDVIASPEEGINELHHQQLGDQPLPKISNCWQILTKELGKEVRQQLQMGFMPTDEILQSQSRLILYGDDDPWNQTAADNAEWLTLFKKAHGLIPSDAKAAGYGVSAAATNMLQATSGQDYMDDGMFQLNLNDEDQQFLRTFQEAGMPCGGFDSFS